MLDWDGCPRIAGTQLFLDSRTPRPLSFVSHAHSDHLPHPEPHGRAIATPITARLAEHRIGRHETLTVDYGQSISLDADTQIRLCPAGHVAGSAMIHVTRPQGTLLYTGDFKLRGGLTVVPADPCPADTLVMETTYGMPFFRFPPRAAVATQLAELAAEALREGRQPIVMGYSLGKAQEIVRILTAAGLPVTCHGAVHSMNDLHVDLGIPLGTYRRYRLEDFEGDAPLDLAERGVLVAPPQVARTRFVNRFENPVRIMCTGWSLLKSAIYRYGVDHALPISDHADFDELLELVDRVRPSQVLTVHGYTEEFASTVRQRGIEARPALPEAQLKLFE